MGPFLILFIVFEETEYEMKILTKEANRNNSTLSVPIGLGCNRDRDIK